MAEHDWLNGSNSAIQQPASGEGYSRFQPAVHHELRPLTTGEILDRTFFLYRSDFWLYVGLASIAAGASAVASIGRLTYFRLNAPMQPASPKAMIASGVLTVVGLLFYFAVYSVTHAATVSAVSSLYLGEGTSMGAALGAVRGHWVRYCLISLWQSWSGSWMFLLLIAPVVLIPMLGLKNLNGFVALLVVLALASFVYGIIAYIRNSLAIPAAVMENLSVRAAMKRSKVLVAGRKGRIFLLGLLMIALYMVAGVMQMPFAILILHSRSAEHILVQIISLLVAFLCSSLIGPVAAIALCLFYIDERVRREAFDIELLMNRTSTAAGAAAGDASAELA
jgi:hypothetical protein